MPDQLTTVQLTVVQPAIWWLHLGVSAANHAPSAGRVVRAAALPGQHQGLA